MAKDMCDSFQTIRGLIKVSSHSTTMSSTKMSVAEAIKWCFAGPTDNELAAMYPTLEDFYERTEAWIDANRDKIKEAMPVYLSLYADKLYVALQSVILPTQYFP
jgi:uncharacterized protein (DUF433 family)